MSSSLSSLLRGRGGGDLSFTCLGGRGGGRERGWEGRLSKLGIDLLVRLVGAELETLLAFLLGTAGGVLVVVVVVVEGPGLLLTILLSTILAVSEAGAGAGLGGKTLLLSKPGVS